MNDIIVVEIAMPQLGTFYDEYFNGWVVVTDYVRDIQTSRGRSRWLETFSSGHMTITLDNRNREFEPFNYSGFGDLVVPRRGIRVYKYDFDTDTKIPLFAGFTDQWNYSYDINGDSICTLTCFDMLGRIATNALGTMKIGRMWSGGRVAACISAPGQQWNGPVSGIIGYGGGFSPWFFDSEPVSYIHRGFMATDAATTVGDSLSEIYRCATVENAEFWATAEGGLMYRKLDWDTELYEKVTAVEWNLIRNPKLEIDNKYWTKGTRELKLSNYAMKSALVGSTPTVIYEDDIPGLDVFPNLVLGFTYCSDFTWTGNGVKATVVLSNDSGLSQTFTKSVPPSSTAYRTTAIVMDPIDPGFTHIKVTFTSTYAPITTIWITKLALQWAPNKGGLTSFTYWDGGTTWSGSDRYVWDTETQTATIKKVRDTGALVHYKAKNTFEEDFTVVVTGVNPSSYNITDTIDNANPQYFEITNSATGTYVSGGKATVKPLGTSMKYTTASETISYKSFAISDNGTGIPYNDISLAYATEELYNRIVITNVDGKTFVTGDKTSQDTYGVFTYQLTDVLTSSSADSVSVATNILSAHKDPSYRVESARIRLNDLTQAQRDELYAIDIFDVCTSTFTPNNIGDPLVHESYVIGIDHEITPETHDIVFKLATKPAGTTPYSVTLNIGTLYSGTTFVIDYVDGDNVLQSEYVGLDPSVALAVSRTPYTFTEANGQLRLHLPGLATGATLYTFTISNGYGIETYFGHETIGGIDYEVHIFEIRGLTSISFSLT